MSYEDITGERFGDMKVLRLSEERCQNGQRLWEVECGCKRVFLAKKNDLRSGRRTCCPECSKDKQRKHPVIPNAPKFDALEDCRAYHKGKCIGLTEMLCRTKGECKFYKPRT